MKATITEKEIRKVAKEAISHCQKVGFYVQDNKLEYFNYTGHRSHPDYVFFYCDTRGLTVKELIANLESF